MKVELVSFVSANGLSLVLHPEGEIEQKLIYALGKHGVLEQTNGELRIAWKFREDISKPEPVGR